MERCTQEYLWALSRLADAQNDLLGFPGEFAVCLALIAAPGP